VLQENLAGIRVVKAFARADNEIERFGVANDSLMSINIKAARFGALTMPLMMFVLNVGVVAALWIGGYKVVEGQLQVGQIIAFINYLLQTMMNLMMVSMLIMGLSRAGASAVRIQEVLDDEPKVKNNPGAMILEEPRGEIRFENVSFRYDDDEADLVLKDLNFTIEPGQTVAILGATGSGKSSLVNLIPRFYDVTQGQILLDGVDVREIDEGSLRRTVSIALQESVLFSGTIRENIAYGNPEASDDDVLKAAQVAQADKFIRECPKAMTLLSGSGV
jgi:ATP-binding cassette subfamily B protein